MHSKPREYQKIENSKSFQGESSNWLHAPKMIVKTTRSPHQFIATQVKNYLLYKQQINCTHAIQTATTLPGTDMHFHSHPSDHRTTPVVQLKETRTKETTAAKILSPLSFQTDDHRSMFMVSFPRNRPRPCHVLPTPSLTFPPLLCANSFTHSVLFLFLFFLLFRSSSI